MNERQLLDNLNTAVLLFDEELALRYVNHAAEMLFAMSGRHMLGMGANELIPCAQADARGRLDYARRSGEAVTGREVLMRFPGQTSQITVDCTISPVDNDGVAGGFLVEMKQVDRQIRISREEQLIAQQEASRELIRGFAHEIKNPLGGLRGAAQLLEQELSDPEQREFTDVIINEADRLRELVDRMLGPKTLPHFETVNVHEVLEHVRKLVRAESGDSLEIIRDYDPSIPDIHADSGQLVQAFLNIARNAARAVKNEEHGQIVFRSRIQRQYTIGSHRHRLVAQIDCIDNGPGIPDGLKEKVFLPMVSASDDGSGLGLTIAQALLAGHDGLIECSGEPGHTVFTVLLPLESSNDTK